MKNTLHKNKYDNPDPLVDDLVQKISTVDIKQIISKNPYEMIVPYSLWFTFPNYSIRNLYENKQRIRMRYLGNSPLTPIPTKENVNINPINKILDNMPLYQPFYPETYFSMYEVLNLKHLKTHLPLNVCHFGSELSLGSIEAVMMYLERCQIDSFKNTYDVFVSDNFSPSTDILDYSFYGKKIKYDYLSQPFHVRYVTDSNEFENKKYDLISFDFISKSDKVLGVLSEEKELNEYLFYLVKSLKLFKNKGLLIMRLNFTYKKSWCRLFALIQDHFGEYIFHRPVSSNPINPEVYLIASNFNAKNSTPNLYEEILVSNYEYNAFNHIELSPLKDRNKIPLFVSFMAAKKKWNNNAHKYLESIKQNIPPNKKLLSDWYQQNNIIRIGEIVPHMELEVLDEELSKITNMPDISPTLKIDLLQKEKDYASLIKGKSNLNLYKRVMDTKPSRIYDSNKYGENKGTLFTWEDNCQKLDTYNGVRKNLRNKKVEIFSNAWTKMFEILHLYPTLTKTFSKELKSFHICEAPGAFVSAVNYYLEGKGVKWTWYAQTLIRSDNATSEPIQDFFDLIKTHPSKWIFGDKKNDSGDITKSDVIKAYVNNPLLSDIDFMTADGGINLAARDLNNQESQLSKLLLGQITCILACLKKGGNAVIKVFLPLSEPITISFIYLLRGLFNDMKFSKPISSHDCNSEVYLILQSYKGIDKKNLNKLYGILDSPDYTSDMLLFEKIDKKFLSEYSQLVQIFVDQQIKSLARNYYYFLKLEKAHEYVKVCDDYSAKWIDQYTVKHPQKRLLNDQD